MNIKEINNSKAKTKFNQLAIGDLFKFSNTGMIAIKLDSPKYGNCYAYLSGGITNGKLYFADDEHAMYQNVILLEQISVLEVRQKA